MTRLLNTSILTTTLYNTTYSMMFKVGDQFKTLAEAKEAIKAAILDSGLSFNVGRGVSGYMA